MKAITTVLSLVVLLGVSVSANATLTTIGTATYGGSDYNLIWDDDNNGNSVIWLDYTNAGNTWQNQNNWTSELNTDLTINLSPLYTTTTDWSTGWRLPSTDESVMQFDGNNSIWGYEGPDGQGNYDYSGGFNMANSELGSLFFNSLGNKARQSTDGTFPQPGFGLNNTGDFNNLQPSQYWSGTEATHSPTTAWYFSISDGILGNSSKEAYWDGLAVHSGTVFLTADGSVTTDQPYLTDFITLQDKLSFDYYWEMGIEPTEFNFDILAFNGVEWEKFDWKDNHHGGSSTDWMSALVNVPGWARGETMQLLFSLEDGGQQTDPTVYLRNLTSLSVPIGSVPEPATMLLFGTGLIGLVGFSIRRRKKVGIERQGAL